MLEQDENQRLEPLHSLITFDNFKALMGIDDREEKQARFCLITATLNIEQYCKRSFLRKQYFETVKFTDNLVIPLKEYPVTEILTVYAENLHGCRFSALSFCVTKTHTDGSLTASMLQNSFFIEPEFYRPMLGNDYNTELPFELLLSASLIPYKLAAVKVIYWAGYKICDLPTDLAAACMELAMWSMNRYRSRRIGITGNIRSSGAQGEHFENSMPENVRQLIEPHRRKVL